MAKKLIRKGKKVFKLTKMSEESFINITVAVTRTQQLFLKDKARELSGGKNEMQVSDIIRALVDYYRMQCRDLVIDDRGGLSSVEDIQAVDVGLTHESDILKPKQTNALAVPNLANTILNELEKERPHEGKGKGKEDKAEKDSKDSQA